MQFASTTATRDVAARLLVSEVFPRWRTEQVGVLSLFQPELSLEKR